MAHLKYQPMPSPTCLQLLLKIVTALFPRQQEFIYTSQQLNPEDIPLVTKEELMEACNRVGNNKAPGLNVVPNIVLKTSIKVAPELFLDVYNTCLKEGTFPRKWKQQRLVLLPKGKKSPKEPSSYRPLCIMGSGGRSTLDAINLVVNIAKDAIAGTRWKGSTKKYCLVAALDIRNAFNSASWACIMQALRGKNVPEYLCRIVASYFRGKVLKYDANNGPKEYGITGGVPQSSVLGPLFWNIMYDGLLRLNIPRRVKLVAYADDVAVVIIAKYLDEIRRLFDITFENHITASCPIFGSDARLNFMQQVEHVSAKASAVVTSLARLIPNVGGPKQTRRLLLSSVVTSVLTYGISIWANALDT
ncbi:Putative 115 kDa protein in type-1 retrotransposable element R1DM [Eumeta japonica]|uniref:115 kDa protein in type-1 retrotransposable element R1DM n=1 Tax=Eumeta variegata TaxID=151549 RepID=A0A4C1VFR4_EUMVA|nr:Putative 115 kDa protein in type-1 retrotransposable element R1DM [Eumeta japonica]